MQRRSFLKWTGTSAMATLTPLLAQAAQAPLDNNIIEGEQDWSKKFEIGDAPWKLAYRSASHDLSSQADVRGQFPAAVQGLLFRNGPAVHDLGGQRYHHWFDGDGMMQRFAIGKDTVTHTGKIIRTPKYLAESAANKRLYNSFGTTFAQANYPGGPDTINVANTSVLPLNGELLALWEGGSAFRVDQNSLQTYGAKVWRDDLAGVPFSAHPKVDPDGTVWNFGVSMLNDMLVLYQIGSDGKLRRAESLKIDQISMIHDFAVTSRHLVFLLPPLVMDMHRLMTGSSYLDAHQWKPELGMRVLVVSKEDFSKRQWLDLPAGFLFHIGNAWEDAAGVITVDYVRSDAPDILFKETREVMRGQYHRSSTNQIAVVRIDTAAARASQQLLAIDSEFPRIDQRQTGYRHQTIYHATGTTEKRPGFNAIARTNIDNGSSEHFTYGDHYMVEEHIFVPENGSRPGGAGWVLGTALDLDKQVTTLSCFAADRLADGPVAQASLPYALPLGLHGNFVKT